MNANLCPRRRIRRKPSYSPSVHFDVEVEVFFGKIVFYDKALETLEKLFLFILSNLEHPEIIEKKFLTSGKIKKKL